MVRQVKQIVSRMAYASTRIHKPTDRNYYGTPTEFVAMARKVMGSIELDPASCAEANDLFVGAERFYDERMNGLCQSWACESMFLNPPYSGNGCFAFTQKFAKEADGIKQAIVLVNSATGTRAFRHLFDNCDAICFCNRRIQFIDPTGQRSQTNNSKEQLFFYRGKRVKAFVKVFGAVGRIVKTKVTL